MASGEGASVESAADGIAKTVVATMRPHRAAPGSHVDVRIDSGAVRSYSIISTADGGECAQNVGPGQTVELWLPPPDGQQRCACGGAGRARNGWCPKFLCECRILHR